MAVLDGDGYTIVSGETQKFFNNPPPPPPPSSFSPWGSGAGAMIGAGNLSGDLNGDGLDDTTGWAVGITADSSSPSGFSYNGTPTYSNGAVYNVPSANNSASLALNYGGGNDAYLATGDANGDGLDDVTGLAVGVTQDYNSPTGYSYNGQPTYGNGAAYFSGGAMEAPITPNNSASLALNYGGGQDQYLGQYSPGAVHDPYAAYRDTSGNVNGVMDPYDPRINPETAREDIYGNASNGGNPFNVVATGLLNQWNVPGADIIGPAIGTLADAATFGAGSGMAGGNMDVYDPAFWGEAGMAAANAGSLGLGGGIIKNAGANIAGNLAGKYIPQGLQQYSETNLPGADIAGNPYVQTGAGILGAIGAGAAGYAGAGALASGVKRAPGAFDKAITGLDARINEPAFSPDQPMVFSTGRKAGPERTVIPESNAIPKEELASLSQQRILVKERLDWAIRGGLPTGALRAELNSIGRQEAALLSKAGTPQPLANDRLWFHSTRDMSYDLPDPDLAVGTQTGITQGPGIYMAADPAKSAGNYGPRTFVTEFDGKVLDLTKPMRIDEPVFTGGPTWAKIRDDLAVKFEAKGFDATPIRQAFDSPNLTEAARSARAELATPASAELLNGYVYRQALDDAVGKTAVHFGAQSDASALTPFLGRFKEIAKEDPKFAGTYIKGVTGNHLADEGVDALFHHSPRADGDVLIVLNGEKARVVADVKNAPDAVRTGATLKDIRRNATKEIVGSAATAVRQTKDITWQPGGEGVVYGDVRGNPSWITIKKLDQPTLSPTGEVWQGWVDGQSRGQWQSLQEAKDGITGYLTGRFGKGDAVSLRTFGQRLSDETGALDMGAIGDMANATRRSLPGRAVAKVTPGGFEVTPGAAEGGTRIGDLLHAPTGEALGPNYTPQQVLRVERTLTRRAGSVANTLDAEAAPAWKTLGPTFKDDAGNIYLKNIKPSKAEIDAGLPGALAVRVVERPNEYALTAAQRNAVDKLGEITQRVTNEKVALGYDQRTVQLDEGDIYQHRVALKPSTAKQAEGLVSSNARTAELTPPGGGGSRLSIGTDKTRLYDDPVQAVRDGVVYDNPKNAMAANIDTGLRKAVNTHVKNLLEPFGQTSADRVSPELRAQVEGIRQRIQSLKDTGTRLGDRTDRVIDRFLADPGANLDDLRDALPVRVGANAVGKQGINFGKTRQELNQTLLGLRKDLNDVAPQWRKEIAASRSPLPGRRTIPMEIAPALAGRDFDRTTAARIISHYGGGIRIGDRVMETKIPFVKGINAILTPVNATADFSVTLNQLAMTAASHPFQFAKNLALSMKDMIDDAGYQRWLSSTKASDAAKYVTIHGHAGPESDFLSKALRKFPLIGQTQKQFERFGNRMRVDAFNAVADSAAKSAKRPLDDLAKEQIGKAIDRVTGVSTTRATDFERTVQFAPNFFRSIIETTAHAAMDGSLEGQVARQYLKNYAALGAGLVTAAALQQGRDPREVLSPFDMKAWQKGEIRLNPNWMTVRVVGQDVKVFGTYDSAIKLLVTAADAGYRSVDQKDASQLFDFLGYAGSTKGSPVVKFITDLIKGETFTHENPYSPTSLASRLLPISAQTAIQDYQKGMSGKDIAADVGLSVIGAKSSPVTDYEKRQQEVIDAGYKDANDKPITRWEDLSYDQQIEYVANHPDSVAAHYQSVNPEAVASRKARTLAGETLAEEQTKIDTKYLTDGKPNSFQDGKDWRDQYHAQQFAARVAYKTLEKEHPFTGDPNKEPQHAAVDEYFNLMDSVSVGSKVDWDVLDKWKADNPEKAKLVDSYFAHKSSNDLTPGITAYKAASKAIGDSGFFDLGSYDWAQVQKAAPDAAGFASYDEYRNAVIDNWKKQYMAQGYDAEKAASKASSAFSNTAIAKAEKAAQTADNATQTAWMLQNPDAAVQAYRWGYWQPQKTIIGVNGLPRGVSELQWLTDYINRTGQ